MVGPKIIRLFTIAVLFLAASSLARAAAPLVLMTDFGVKDGAVSEMKGVSYGVSPALLISDLTHEIPAGDIWEGSYRLYQVAPYWPKGTVFVGVIDPGVGTSRLSVVVKTRAEHYYVLPDNGLITLIAEVEGVEEVRTIDETINRLKGSEKSNTFHGRDVFGYTGARLAAGVITWEQVGPVLASEKLILIPHQKARHEGDALIGTIPALDIQFGNVWSDIPEALLTEMNVKPGDKLTVEIYHGGKLADKVTAPFAKTFGDVPKGQPLVYINSLLNVSVALNLGDYAKVHHIASGGDWSIRIHR